MKDLKQVKILVSKGHKVFWKSSGYQVIKDRLGQYLVKYIYNDSCIGLDGNHRAEDFFKERKYSHSCGSTVRHFSRDHFFDESTMKFFKSILYDFCLEFPKEIYFLTSEKGPNNKRLFTVRKIIKKSGSVEKVSEFQAYSTKNQAEKAMIKICNEISDKMPKQKREVLK